jgi:hypothetical protein
MEKEGVMNKPFRYGKSATRRSGGYISPERLTTLKLIFEAVCDELAIPGDATGERELLACKLMATARTVESEKVLVTMAMEAIADHRQRFSASVSHSLEPQAKPTPTSDIHAKL